MTKYVAVLAGLSLFACGTGPDAGQPLGESVQQQRIPRSSSRIAPVDQQSVGVVDPQAIPGSEVSGGGAQLPGNEADCEQFCEQSGGDCALGNCMAACQALSRIPGGCAQALLDYASCVGTRDGDCENARLECALTYQSRLEGACANVNLEELQELSEEDEE